MFAANAPQIDGFTYEVVDEPMSFSDAQQFCRNGRGDLPWIINVEDNALFAQFTTAEYNCVENYR